MPDRREAELAVIEAAREVVDRGGTFNMENVPDLWSALHRLDSLPTPAPAGETERVRVGVFRNENTGGLDSMIGEDRIKRAANQPHWFCTAIITANIPMKPPSPPEIVGTVEEPQ